MTLYSLLQVLILFSESAIYQKKTGEEDVSWY